jgi:hypothetical protein
MSMGPLLASFQEIISNIAWGWLLFDCVFPEKNAARVGRWMKLFLLERVYIVREEKCLAWRSEHDE